MSPIINQSTNQPISIFPLGDSAACIDLGNNISVEKNQKVLAIHQWLLLNPFAGIKDIIVAYCSLAIIYDPYILKKQIPLISNAFEFVKLELVAAYQQSGIGAETIKIPVNIPVCYDEAFGVDLAFISEQNNISIEKIIRLHTSKPYRVYMLGFLPGFPYMAEVDEQIAFPRKQKPVHVKAGSVGIAGIQTGIYPFDSPGGWNIIGQTPLCLFDSTIYPPAKLHPGDMVQFYQVTKNEFKKIELQNSPIQP
ncbi:MAG TPA: 5-oxoprolinase subunit PxpB [Ferruginibacter sp.]|nr:5-oxoprolinase subunit PxpB [Ferruginibacter sp.]